MSRLVALAVLALAPALLLRAQDAAPPPLSAHNAPVSAPTASAPAPGATVPAPHATAPQPPAPPASPSGAPASQPVAQPTPPVAPLAPGARAAAPLKRLLKHEATLESEAPVQALAINADESILALAGEKGGSVLVTLVDRPSHARLGLIQAKVGSHPRLLFAPDQDLLAVAGSKAVQLWEVAIAPLKPDQPLPSRYLRWEQALPGGAGPPALAFASPGEALLWVQQGALYRRGEAAGSPAPEESVWKPAAGGPVLGVQAAHGSLLVELAGSKDLTVLEGAGAPPKGTLQGHRFPPLAGVAVQANGAQGYGHGWVSLDEGGNLMRWSDAFQPQDTVFLGPALQGQQSAGLAALGARHLLVTVGAEGGGRAVITSGPAWQAEDALPLAAPSLLAVSPTGRYLLAVQAEPARAELYSFAQPLAPLDYVRRLQALHAFGTAQGYVRLLDEHAVSAAVKASLLAELSRVPPSALLHDYQERLARAREEGDTASMRRWAEQVLNLAPDDALALQALQALKVEGERRLLQQAQAALEQDQTAEAIAMLSSQIAPDSPLFGQASALIRRAEAQRQAAVTLEQAREQMNLGNAAAAQALVKELLRQQPGLGKAVTLQAEIEERAHGGGRNWLAALLGTVLAVALVALLLYRNRGRLLPRIAPEPPVSSPLHGSGPGPDRRPEPGAPTGGGARPPPGNGGAARPPNGGRAGRQERGGRAGRVSEPHRAGGGPAGRMAAESAKSSPARMQVVQELLQRTEDLMRLARQADVAREHTALLMALEAELAAFHRRLADPAVDLGPIHQRLKDVTGQLRNLQFARPAGAEGAAPREAEEGRSLYDVLSVPETATEGEIKSAFHRLLKQYHPDLHTRSDFAWVKDEAERMSRRLSAAYEVLGNPERRQDYDRELRRRRQSSSKPGAA